MSKKIEHILKRIAASHQLDILWKSVGTPYHDCGLSLEHTLHDNEFCRAVKSDPVRLRRCVKNDNYFLPIEAKKYQQSFVRSCHAGVSELVVPYLTEGRCIEAILLGIFREAKFSCPYRELHLLYHSIPLRQSGAFNETGLLLNDLLPVLRHYRESLLKMSKRIKDTRIREAVTMMQREFNARLTVGKIATRVFLSESRFMHLFKTQTGLSFTAFLLNIRLEHSARLLTRTSLNIWEVMESSGFNDQSYFSTCFKKRTGYSPLVYRRMNSEITDI